MLGLPMLSEAKAPSEATICLLSDNPHVFNDLKHEFKEMDVDNVKVVPCTWPPIVGLCNGQLLNDVYENEIEELGYAVVSTDCQPKSTPADRDPGRRQAATPMD